MRVYVARHAETNYNVLGLCNDNPKINVYLTEKGIKQAELLRDSLKEVNFDLVITSEFPRTKQTALIVNKYHKAPIIEDARINDIITGFEGKPVEDYRRIRNADKNFWTVRLNGGESFEDAELRVKAFLGDLKSRPEKTVLVVTHQAIARLLYLVANNLPHDMVNDIEAGNAHAYQLEL